MKDKNEKQVTLRGGHWWRGSVKEGNKQGEYGWCTFDTRVNIESP
jgi:hypothetical protein